MNLSTRILTGFAIVFLIFLSASCVVYYNTEKMIEIAQKTDFSREQQQRMNLLIKSLIDFETGERGFLLTGKEEFLEPYNSAKSELTGLLNNLRENETGEAQNAILEKVASLKNQWQNTAAEPVIEMRRRINEADVSFEQIRDFVASARGKNLMDEMRALTAEYLANESQLIRDLVEEELALYSQNINLLLYGNIISLFLGVLVMTLVARSVIKDIGGEPRDILQITKRLANGELDIAFDAGKKTGILASVQRMARSLKDYYDDLEGKNRLQKGQTELAAIIRGDQSIKDTGNAVISFLAEYLEARIGIIYRLNEDDELVLAGSYAYQKRKHLANRFQVGEGLVGQAAYEKQPILLTRPPEDYIEVTSGLGAEAPESIFVVPLIYNDSVEGVIELGFFRQLEERDREFLEKSAESIAIALSMAKGRDRLERSLRTTQAQSEELQQQQEELQAANEEMEEQTQVLQTSESRLKQQQEELQAANEELEEKTEFLERNRKEIQEQNTRLEIMHQELETKAEDLGRSSQYKSEFLANMSHELRTPLNSLLLLSRLLMDNRDGNLTDDQIESAQVIYNSGNDLLQLINEILDLSKIEAGKMKIEAGPIKLEEMAENLRNNFEHQAADKGLRFSVKIADNSPETIISDRQRVEQITKNLVSNSIKFTDEGTVSVDFFTPDEATSFTTTTLANKAAIGIRVHDTGTGIPADKLQEVFEAFQQVEGGTSRKYGGTGLGLSISRELAKLLGGEIQLESEVQKGSTFTLFLPVELDLPEADARPADGVQTAAPAAAMPAALEGDKAVASHGNLTVSDKDPDDDRLAITRDDRTILIIEDDLKFAGTLKTVCHERGFKVVIAATGEEGITCAERYQPDGIILDIHLPGIDGWQVLDTLKNHSSTRHIPIHFMSADDMNPEALQKGAIGFLSKPIDREEIEQALISIENLIDKQVKQILLVEDNEDQRFAITRLLGGDDIVIHEAISGAAALSAVRENYYDCVIVDLGLPDMSGFEMISIMAEELEARCPPIIVNTGKEMSQEEERLLREYSDSIIIKGVRSEERLLDETSLFLHQMVEKMPESKKRIISALHDSEQDFQGKRILIVDDDMRNVFALSRSLKQHGLQTVKAENGAKALDILARRDDIDLILMDIMMPVMDGYETMRQIRSQNQFTTLPIIALTAKAMAQDRDECISAGANDYLSKPVNVERLLSMLRVWLQG